MSVEAPVELDHRQQQARALGDATRYGIYRSIEAATAPVTVAELTEQFRLNHNAIRQHLAVLCRAGLVIEDLAPPTGPGRRRLRYRVDRAAAAAWSGDNPYEQLAVLLVEVLRSDRSPRDVGYLAGMRFAGRGRRRADDPVGALVNLVARQGFNPRLTGDADRAEIILDRCPFAAAATADPATVCALHRGLADGMAEALDPGLRVTELVVRNPKRAGCRIRLDIHEGVAGDV